MKLTYRFPAGLKNRLARATEMGRLTARAGWAKDMPPSEHTTLTGEELVEKAEQLEYGGVKRRRGRQEIVPAQPFLRTAQTEHAKEWQQAVIAGFNSTRPPTEVLQNVAEQMATDIRQSLAVLVETDPTSRDRSDPEVLLETCQARVTGEGL